MWLLMCTSQTNSRISILDGTLKSVRQLRKTNALLALDPAMVYSRLAKTFDTTPLGGFWLLCRALFLLHTVLQFVFDVTWSSRQVRLLKLVKVAATGTNARSPISATPVLEALTRNRGSNLSPLRKLARDCDCM